MKSDANLVSINDDDKTRLQNKLESLNLRKSSDNLSVSIMHNDIGAPNINDNNRYVRQQVWCLDVRFCFARHK